MNFTRLYREPEEYKRISLCETCLNVTATMAAITQIILCMFFLTQSKIIHGTEPEINTKEEKSEELLESESKDGKLEIIKRIKKINDDGSYTIGYEADDGSFKIESRDVLGQIKGTYGFVDEEGQIKRVSYSTSNSSEIITKSEPPSVVQRIPNKNKTTPTRIPITTQSTTPTTTSNSVVQSIARRRSTTTTSTTTQRPNYSEVINVAARTTSRPSTLTYTSPPRVLIQNRLPVTSTVATQTHTAKSEGQLIRPEVVTVRPTELPLFRRLALKQLDKPVTEEPEPEARGNILRRQLSQENTREYNLQEHLYSLQQSLGHDATDVYSASMTTGTPRPLFTTTSRPRIISAPSPSPSVAENAPRPTIRYPLNYQRNVLQDLERNSHDYAQETTTTDQPVSVPSTQTPVPVIQLPPGAESQEPLVAIRHPFQKGTILVPLSQLQGRLIPVENARDLPERQKQYASQQEQFYRETTTRPNVVEIEQQQAVVRRLPPPPLRPIPVQVDENGYIRELPQNIQPSYPVPVPIQVMPAPKYRDNEIDGDIDNIEPPVSTRDFQKLLQQLIVRQSRLEKISALTRQPDIYLQDQQQQQQRYRAVYPQSPEPYYVRRESSQTNGPVQFIQRNPEGESQQRLTPRQFFEMSDERQRKQTVIRPQSVFENQYDQQSFRPNRRVARLLPRSQQRQQEVQDEYLPPDVREMLLLRMLQLAINPALPLDDDKFDLPAAATQVKRMPVRNVEILGEEEEPDESPRRSEKVKRMFRESETNYE